MFKQIFTLLIVLVLMLSLTACKKTPDKEVVLGKDLDRVLTEAQSTEDKPVGSNLREKLCVPETYTANLKDAKGNLEVNVNAVFNLPNTDKLPTAKVKMDTFSQATADKLIHILLQGQSLFDADAAGQRTKADIEKRLIDLYAMKAGTMPVQVDGSLDENIAIWEEAYDEAPETAEMIPIDTKFKSFDVSIYGESTIPIEPYDCIEGVAQVNGKPAYLSIVNQTQENKIKVLFVNRSSGNEGFLKYSSISKMAGKELQLISEQNLCPLNLTSEQAKQQSDEVIKELGLDYMVCIGTEKAICFADGAGMPNTGGGTAQAPSEEGAELQPSTPGNVQHRQAYITSYIRAVNEVAITPTLSKGGSPASEMGDANYVAGWPFEMLDIVIDDSGIIEFYWVSPYTEPEIVTDDTKLLTFSEIQQIFEKMIIVKNSWIEDRTVQMDIDTVQLGLMRVTSPDERNVGILIPVWDFFGTVDNSTERPRDSLLTINAVDGTIIDRRLGY